MEDVRMYYFCIYIVILGRKDLVVSGGVGEVTDLENVGLESVLWEAKGDGDYQGEIHILFFFFNLLLFWLFQLLRPASLVLSTLVFASFCSDRIHL